MACNKSSSSSMKKYIIAAVADNMAIGRDNELLWHISADMKYFRKITMGAPIIMGYKTWLSIGRPLPGRKNIVITKHPFEAAESIVQVRDVDSAFAAAALPSAEGVVPEHCFIIGGAKTYERTLSKADKLYITHVYTSVPDADAFFPVIDSDIWKIESETPTEIDPNNGLKYSFVVYSR